jgi:hypothetical protein
LNLVRFTQLLQLMVLGTSTNNLVNPELSSSRLSFLQSISMYDNTLFGTIPSEQKELIDLELLSLGTNMLMGHIP